MSYIVFLHFLKLYSFSLVTVFLLCPQVKKEMHKTPHYILIAFKFLEKSKIMTQIII